MRYTGKDDRRRHLRCSVYELCRVVVEGREYEGAVIDLSMGGAAFQMDVQIMVQPEVGTPVALFIERIGRIPAKVVRPLTDGFAVEFRIDRDQGRHLGAALKEVLDDYRSENS